MASSQTSTSSPSSNTLPKIRVATWNVESLRRVFEVLKHVVGEKSDFAFQYKKTYDLGNGKVEHGYVNIPRSDDTLVKFVTAYKDALDNAKADVICVQEGLTSYNRALRHMCDTAKKRLNENPFRGKDAVRAGISNDTWSPTTATADGIESFFLSMAEHMKDDKSLFNGYTCVVSSGHDYSGQGEAVKMFKDKIYRSKADWDNWKVYGKYGENEMIGKQADQIHVREGGKFDAESETKRVIITSTQDLSIYFEDPNDTAGPYKEYKLVPRTLVTVVLKEKRGSNTSDAGTRILIGCTHVSGGRFEDVNALREDVKNERGYQMERAATHIETEVAQHGCSHAYLLGDFNACDEATDADHTDAIKRQALAMVKVLRCVNPTDTELENFKSDDNECQRKFASKHVESYRSYIHAPFATMKIMRNAEYWTALTSACPYQSSFFVWPVDHCWVYRPRSVNNTMLQQHKVGICITTNHFKLRAQFLRREYLDAISDFKQRVVSDDKRYTLLTSFTKFGCNPLTDHSMVVISTDESELETPGSLTSTPPSTPSTASTPKSDQRPRWKFPGRGGGPFGWPGRLK
jgi:hypothetical protein